MSEPTGSNPFGRSIVGNFNFVGENHRIEDCTGESDEDESQHLEELVLENLKTTSLVMGLQTFPPNDTVPDGLNIKGHIRHVRRSPTLGDQSWDDYDYLNLSTLRKDEHVKIELRSTQLRSIFMTLFHRYRASGGLDILLGQHELSIVDYSEVTVISGNEREILSDLLQRDPEFWDHILDIDTANALDMMLSHRVFMQRRAALREFATQMAIRTWKEGDWQRFFAKNEWIFGYGAAYQYVDIVREKANLGGKSILGAGGAEVDFLLATLGDVRYTVLLDIKTPQAPLVVEKTYRNRVFVPDDDLIGGAAQLQNYLYMWSTKGALDDVNLEEMDALTFSPKGILVIGMLNQLDSRDKRKSFELFRRSQQSPEIITFDELFERASYILNRTLPDDAEQDLEIHNDDEEFDEVPF